ncbi:S26 family signal peptidase [Agrobacterium sp. BT-220-3]|nr:S26 family signal peptidase [Agrobacterium sp. BT-220-3]
MTRFGYVMVTYFSIMGVAIASFIPTPTRLVWNVSASAPIGLYDIDPLGDLPGDLIVTDLVAVDPPEALADFMVERSYIGRGVPLLKRVMGLPGQEVCRVRRTVTVDGIEIGTALDRDRTGREMPVWNGCRRIAGDEIFLMNPDVRDSLDGRYFGPIPASSVSGRATPIYTDEDGDGRFVWYAATR